MPFFETPPLSSTNPGSLPSTIALLHDGADAEYSGMLCLVSRGRSQEFTLLADYTDSHCIDEGGFQDERPAPQFQNPSNRNGGGGNCEFGRRQLIDSSFAASMPQSRGTGMRRDFSDWQTSAILTKHSRRWFNPSTGTGQTLTAAGHDRPVLVPGVSATVPDPGIAAWINSAASVPDTPGTFGSAGRCSLEGPGATRVDTAVPRRVPVRESQKVELRFGAFKAFNHARFDNPQTSLRSGQSGQTTRASDPRILRLALKRSF